MSTNAPKRKGKKAVPALTPADSLAMLRSAIGYVMQSGLVVGASNHKNGLVIIVKGAQLTSDSKQFVPAITPIESAGG